jgi:hypothetical protein
MQQNILHKPHIDKIHVYTLKFKYKSQKFKTAANY